MLTPIRARAGVARAGVPGDGGVKTRRSLDTAGRLDDETLVAALAARDDLAVAALGALYDRHAPAVYGYLQERLGSDEHGSVAGAADALDEVFHRLWSRPSIAPRGAARRLPAGA